MPSHKMITGITPNSQAVNAAAPHGSQTIIRKKELGLEKSTGAPPPREESEKLHVCVCACVCELCAMGTGKEEQPMAGGTDDTGKSRASAPERCVQGWSPCPELHAVETKNLVQQAPVLPEHGKKEKNQDPGFFIAHEFYKCNEPAQL